MLKSLKNITTLELGLYTLANSTGSEAEQYQPSIPARPLLKWAGGKTQMLNDIRQINPLRRSNYGR